MNEQLTQDQSAGYVAWGLALGTLQCVVEALLSAPTNYDLPPIVVEAALRFGHVDARTREMGLEPPVGRLDDRGRMLCRAAATLRERFGGATDSQSATEAVTGWWNAIAGMRKEEDLNHG